MSAVAPGLQSSLYLPMHPRIRCSERGNCPICGMTLEPLRAAADGAPSAELRDMTRRLWIGAALAVPVLILEMTAHFPGLNVHRYVSPQASIWMQFFLGSPVVVGAG